MDNLYVSFVIPLLCAPPPSHQVNSMWSSRDHGNEKLAPPLALLVVQRRLLICSWSATHLCLFSRLRLLPTLTPTKDSVTQWGSLEIGTDTRHKKASDHCSDHLRYVLTRCLPNTPEKDRTWWWVSAPGWKHRTQVQLHKILNLSGFQTPP